MTGEALSRSSPSRAVSPLLSLEASAALARPLRRWSPDEIEAIRARLGEVLRTWSADWIAGPAAPGERVELAVGAPATALFPAASAACWTFDAPSSQNHVDALSIALFGGSDREGEIARHTAQAAWDDWLARLAALRIRLEGAPRRWAPRNDHAKPAHRWARELYATLPWCGGRLHMVLPEDTVAAMLDGKPSPGASGASAGRSRNDSRSAPKATLGDALSEMPFALRVVLADAALNLGQIQALAIGDIVPIDHPVDLPARLFTPDGTALCAGWLGQADGHFAVELAPLHHTPDITSIAHQNKQ
jgi:flagellar motor switch/type III secretory pathway protein FliN